MDIPRNTPFSRALPALALIAVLLCACGRQDEVSLIKSAKEYMAKRDYAAASIQLKNIIQKQENGEARHLLALAYIELGDYAAAELQLRQAQAANYSPGEIYPALAKVMLGLGEFRKLVAEMGNTTVSDSAGQASIKTALGNAYIELGQYAAARQALLAALSAAPSDPAARVGLARVSAAEGDTTGASAEVDQILAASAAFAPALALKADLLIAQTRRDEAIAVLSKLVQIAPYNAQARFSLVNQYIAADKFEQAAAGIVALKKMLPRDIRGTYLEALLAFRQNKPAVARDAVVQVLNAIPDHAPALVLAGAAEYQLGSLSTAIDYLRKALAKHPDNIYARNLLVSAYLRQGQPDKAEEALLPALQMSPQDPGVLRTAGEVAFANHKLQEAADYYEQALALETDNAALRLRLAEIRLAQSGVEITGDEANARANGNGKLQAELARIAAAVARKDYSSALASATALEEKHPANPLVLSAKGSVYIAQRDLKNARINFERALAVRPDYLPAARVLAGMDIAEKDPAGAKRRFESILAKQPNHSGALLALAQVQAAISAPRAETTATIERAIKANPASVPARLELIKFLADERDFDGALAASRRANAAIPNEPRIVDALGLAQINAGKIAQAIETFKELAKLMPDSPLPQMRLASAGFAGSQIDAPILALRKALAIKPNLLEAQRGIIAMQLAAGRPQEALAEAKLIQQARPGEAVGYALAGDVFASQKKTGEAANAYAEAIKRQPVPDLIVKQHELLQSAGKPGEADALIVKWLKENPKDPVVPFHLANSALQNKDYQRAAQGYKNVLKLAPDNALVLNNLALALAELKDPLALRYAEQAHAKAPANPAIQDTYGWLLFNSGETERATDLLHKAVQGEPESAEARLHFAKALLKSGDTAGAKKHLEAVAKAKAQTAEKAEAAQLLKAL